jgi:FtsZ-binding cell division protein ZapB
LIEELKEKNNSLKVDNKVLVEKVKRYAHDNVNANVDASGG